MRLLAESKYARAWPGGVGDAKVGVCAAGAGLRSSLNCLAKLGGLCAARPQGVLVLATRFIVYRLFICFFRPARSSPLLLAAGRRQLRLYDPAPGGGCGPGLRAGPVAPRRRGARHRGAEEEDAAAPAPALCYHYHFICILTIHLCMLIRYFLL